MRSKLLATMAAFGIGIAAASCEKNPNEEPSSKQSGSTAAPSQQMAQKEQPEAEKQATQSAPTEEEQHPPAGETATEPPAGQEQQKRQSQADEEGQRPASTQSAPGPSQSTGQSETEAAAARQEQSAHPQQSEPQMQQPLAQQKNEPGQNQPGGPLNLSRDEIRQAQRFLTQKGFEVGEIDGVIGPRTRRAVVAFQRQQGLDPNGQIDQRTAAALGLLNAPGSTTSGRSSRDNQ